MGVSLTEIVVRYAETDRMGVVHHSVYPVWFECGRTDWIKQHMLSYSDIEESGLMLPLLELKCKYMGWLDYEDIVVIKTSLKESTLTRLIFSYDVYRKDVPDKVLTRGETVHVWTDKKLKPVNIKKVNPHMYEKVSGFLQLK